MIKDINFMKYVINYCVDMKALLRQLKVDVPYNGQIFCPFHDNYNTESAKLYRDNDGYKIFCFSEHRIYTSYDIIKDLLNENIYGVYNSIWQSLSNEAKKALEDSFGEVETDEITVPCLEAFDAFRAGEIKYKDLCDIISKAYN